MSTVINHPSDLDVAEDLIRHMKNVAALMKGHKFRPTTAISLVVYHTSTSFSVTNWEAVDEYEIRICIASRYGYNFCILLNMNGEFLVWQIKEPPYLHKPITYDNYMQGEVDSLKAGLRAAVAETKRLEAIVAAQKRIIAAQVKHLRAPPPVDPPDWEVKIGKPAKVDPRSEILARAFAAASKLPDGYGR